MIQNCMKKVLLVAFLSCTALSTYAQFGEQDADSKYGTELIHAGEAVPPLKLKTLDGKKFQLDKLKGKYVVLDFWASWCPDCRKDIPNLKRMYDRFHPFGIEFVGVSFDTDVNAWQEAVKKYDIPYIQISDLKKKNESPVAQAFGVKWIPSLYLINPEGRIEVATVLSDKIEKRLYELTAPSTQPVQKKEVVHIDGAKGQLSGIIQRPELKPGETCPMVVFCHGFGGSKEGPLFEITADTLAAHGIASIRFDFNGHGESEGEFQEMTVPNEIEDAKKVIEYVKDLRYVDGIALVGHSQGGVVASMTAGDLADEDIRCVVLMAPAAVLRDDAIRGSTMGANYDPLDPPEYVELWGGKKLGRNYIKTAFSLPIYETAAKYHGPALIVHGTADRVVPYTYGERYHQIWPGSTLVILDAFDHGFSQNVYRTDEIVSQYLIKQLKP